MKLLGTQFSLKNKSFEFYISGCKGINGVHCKNCHNPESWSFNKGEVFNESYFEEVKNKIIRNNSLIENIMIFGGEPLDQKLEDLIFFLEKLKTLKKPIWLFTGKDIDDIPIDIIRLCDYVKYGSYQEEFKTDNNIQYGIKLATSNQNIIKIKSEDLSHS